MDGNLLSNLNSMTTTIQRWASFNIYTYSMKYIINKGVWKKTTRKQELMERINRVSEKGSKMENISEIDKIVYFH